MPPSGTATLLVRPEMPSDRPGKCHTKIELSPENCYNAYWSGRNDPAEISGGTRERPAPINQIWRMKHDGIYTEGRLLTADSF